MPEYLVSLYQPDGPPPPEVDLDGVMAELERLNADLRDVGAFVFTGGLHASTTATVLRARGDRGDVVMTDGPFAEGKEHVGGFWILQAQDLDCALSWGRRAAQATGLPVEVRPFQHVELA
jgi:hypothetical protein